MDAYVARQPILDRKKRLFAYELLLRNGLSGVFPNIDGDTATSQLLSDSFFTIGIEKLSGRKRAFVNFTQDLLIKRLPLMFPADKIVVEILEDVEPTGEVISACKDMGDKGYIMALDDFVYRPELEPLIDLANIIKFDFKLLSTDEMAPIVTKLADRDLKLLAEKVETHEEFQCALDMGFDYFQGYFFKKPQVVSKKGIASNQMHMLQIMAEANKEEVDFNKLEALIARDVAVPYKLLRYINSAFFRRVGEIASINQAITRLGINETKRFLSLISMTSLAPDKPGELIRLSIVRAKFCELLGSLAPKKIDPSALFMVGLLSMINAILDDTMENLTAKLPLSDDLRKALVEGEGFLFEFLDFTQSYEKGQWDKAAEIGASLGLKEQDLPQHYMQALLWADEMMHL